MYTKSQRAKAKALGQKLVTIRAGGVLFRGPVPDDEFEDLIKFLSAFLKRRYARVKEARDERYAR